ncbi:HNH endonuclease, partial [Gulosibacter sediminis]
NRSDLDHTTPWAAGGPTSVDNQAHLCRRHHTQKHQQPWRVRHLGGGVLEWTSPIGDVFITRPEP